MNTYTVTHATRIQHIYKTLKNVLLTVSNRILSINQRGGHRN